ncbi:MAG: NADH-quinone oxidoreductase subunit N, partial [Angustibacter sp.]
MQAINGWALSPVLAPIAGGLLILALEILWPRAARRLRVPLALGAAALGLLAAIRLHFAVGDGTLSTMCGPSKCSYQVDVLVVAVQAIVLAAAAICLLLAAHEEDATFQPEAFALLLFATGGAAALAAVRDLASLVIALEIASLPIVALIALAPGRRGPEAAMKLLLTALSSFAVISLGVALCYAATGTLYLDGASQTSLGDMSTVRSVAMALLLLGLGFKLTAVPLHWWAPEAFAGAPISISAFIASVAKAAGMAAVLTVLRASAVDLSEQLAPVLAVAAAVTVTVGNIAALGQKSTARFLAWSTVAQAGWLLAALSAAHPAEDRAWALAAAVAYLAVFTLGTLTVFTVVAMVAARHPAGARHELSGYFGLARSSRAQAAGLLWGLCTLAGLPPSIIGLMAKLVVLAVVVDSGSWGLVLALLINLVLGVVVYLRVAAYVFRPQPLGSLR